MPRNDPPTKIRKLKHNEARHNRRQSHYRDQLRKQVQRRAVRKA